MGEFRQLSQHPPSSSPTSCLFCLACQQVARMQNKASVVIGLSGRNLKDLDLFSKSDPYVVISRQTQPGGAFQALRKSETINNNLNPDWKDFLIYESELGTGTNDDIEIEVFDDDRKPGAESHPATQAGNYPASSNQSRGYPVAG